MTYPVTAWPPLSAGAVHETVALMLPAVAITMVGTPGRVKAGAIAIRADRALSPAAFCDCKET